MHQNKTDFSFNEALKKIPPQTKLKSSFSTASFSFQPTAWFPILFSHILKNWYSRQRLLPQNPLTLSCKYVFRSIGLYDYSSPRHYNSPRQLPYMGAAATFTSCHGASAIVWLQQQLGFFCTPPSTWHPGRMPRSPCPSYTTDSAFSGKASVVSSSEMSFSHGLTDSAPGTRLVCSYSWVIWKSFSSNLMPSG